MLNNSYKPINTSSQQDYIVLPQNLFCRKNITYIYIVIIGESPNFAKLKDKEYVSTVKKIIHVNTG